MNPYEMEAARFSNFGGSDMQRAIAQMQRLEQGFEEAYDENYDEGYDENFEENFEEAYAQGYAEALAYAEGLAFEQAYEEGFEQNFVGQNLKIPTTNQLVPFTLIIANNTPTGPAAPNTPVPLFQADLGLGQAGATPGTIFFPDAPASTTGATVQGSTDLYTSLLKRTQTAPFRIAEILHTTTDSISYSDPVSYVESNGFGGNSSQIVVPRIYQKQSDFQDKILRYPMNQIIKGNSGLTFVSRPGVTLTLTLFISAQSDVANKLKTMGAPAGAAQRPAPRPVVAPAKRPGIVPAGRIVRPTRFTPNRFNRRGR